MKQYFIKAFCIAAVATLAVPAFAQKDKDTKEEKKEIENIIITRKGDVNAKTIIEIDGDRVKVNGKDVTKEKTGDVTVRRNRIRDIEAYARVRTPQGNSTWNFNWDHDGMSLLSEDSNRAMLGVVTDSDDRGAKINSVTKGSAAEKAGLKAGDIITRIDDKKIEDAEDVAENVRKHKPGEKVSITVLRDGKEQRITAELGKWKGVRMNAMVPGRVIPPDAPHNFNVAPSFPREFHGNTFIMGGAPKLGLSIQDTDDGKGVKVLEVDEDSNAAKAGVKENDIITHVDDNAVNSTDEISRYVRSHRDKASMMLKVQRNGKTQNIEVRTPRKLKTTDL